MKFKFISRPLRSLLCPGCALLLFVGTVALFAPSVSFSLVDFDDQVFLKDNPIVAEGFSWNSIPRAFTSLHGDRGMYVPLLWLSYLADNAIFGASSASPWGYHLTNVLLHATNAILLFISLRLCTRRTLPALLAAAFWAIHPLRVESVAWVTERKDTLSTFFALATILCYLKAFLPRGDTREPRGRRPALVLSFGFFLLGILAKPMLVTLPFLLMLLDYWPLRRFPLRTAGRSLPCLALKKWPWFLLALLAAILTRILHTGAVASLPLAQRLCRLPSNYLFYLSKSFFPAGLLPMNPGYPFTPPFVATAMLILIALFVVVLLLIRRCPGFSVGILSFVGMLFPVSGIIPVGSYPVADRYSYLPAIGLSIALAALWEWCVSRGRPKSIPSPPQSSAPLSVASIPAPWATFLAVAALLALAGVTHRNLPVWKDTEALRNRLRRFSSYHPFVVAHDARLAVATSGDFHSAARLVQGCIERYPRAFMLDSLAACIANIDGPSAAFDYLSENRPPPGEYLGLWAWRMAQLSLWLACPADALSYSDLAEANLPSQSPLRGNIAHLRAAAYSPDPADALPHALAQWKTYERADALHHFRRLIAAFPSRPDILSNIAWFLSTADWSPAPPSEALGYALRAAGLAPDPPPPGLLDTLAAAHANAGDFPSAIAVQERAISLLPPLSPSLPDYQARLSLYRQSIPYRHDIGSP